ncbi:MAG: hypothetical protein M3P28_02535 [Thermoproteota archaeon]|nr:hypothetical protein [Thermoproteota archaeon]
MTSICSSKYYSFWHKIKFGKGIHEDTVYLREDIFANQMSLNCTGKVLLTTNTSDDGIAQAAKKKLIENGIQESQITLGHDIQVLEKDDLYVSYDPPDLVVRLVYDKKPSGMIKMKNIKMIKI